MPKRIAVSKSSDNEESVVDSYTSGESRDLLDSCSDSIESRDLLDSSSDSIEDIKNTKEETLENLIKQRMEVSLIREEIIKSLLNDPDIKRLLESCGLSEEIFDKMKFRGIDLPKTKLELGDYRDMVSSEYNDGLTDDSGDYCIVYDGKTHKHHGVKVKKQKYVCTKCSQKTEGKKILSAIDEGSFNAQAYRIKKTKTRVATARGFLIKSGIDILDVRVAKMRKRKPFVQYHHKSEWGYRYNKELGLVIKIQPAKGFDKEKYMTVGIDKKCNGEIRKLNKSDILKLNGIEDLTIMKDTVEPKDLEYISSKILQKQTKIC